MVQCCRCNGIGLCKNCSCVKAGKACVDCLPSKRQRCSNTCHQPCPLSPIPSPPAAQPRPDTSPQRATPRQDALQLMQQPGTPTSQPQTVPAGSTDSISGPFQLVPTKIGKLPEFNPLTGPAFGERYICYGPIRNPTRFEAGNRLRSRLTGLQPLVAPQPALKPVKYSVSAYRPAS